MGVCTVIGKVGSYVMREFRTQPFKKSNLSVSKQKTLYASVEVCSLEVKKRASRYAHFTNKNRFQAEHGKNAVYENRKCLTN